MPDPAIQPSPPAGHNGGPRMPREPMPRKLTDTQARALRNIRDHGDTLHGLYGRSHVGGYNNTRVWLDSNELREPWENGKPEKLTERGLRVLAAGRMVP